MSFSPRTSRLPFGSRSATVTVMLPSKRLLWLESAWPSNVRVARELVVEDRRAARRHGPARDDREPSVDAAALRGGRARLLRRVGALDEHDREDVADGTRAQIHEQIEAAGGVVDRSRRRRRRSVIHRRAAKLAARLVLGELRRTRAGLQHERGEQQSTTSDHRRSSYKLLVRCWSIWSAVSIAREFIS